MVEHGESIGQQGYFYQNTKIRIVSAFGYHSLENLCKKKVRSYVIIFIQFDVKKIKVTVIHVHSEFLKCAF